MDEIEEYLKNNTFFCEVFSAKMSDKQCAFQCAKSVLNYSIYRASHGEVDYFSQESRRCVNCEKFKTPTQETIDAVLNTAVRYRDTEDGHVDRLILSYIESSKFLRTLDEE